MRMHQRDPARLIRTTDLLQKPSYIAGVDASLLRNGCVTIGAVRVSGERQKEDEERDSLAQTWLRVCAN